MENNVIVRKWKNTGFIKVDDLSGLAFTGESGAHTFRIHGFDADDNKQPITGTISGKFWNKDTDITTPLTGSLDDGDALVTFDPACYANDGLFVLTLFSTNGSTVTCIYCGVGSVKTSQSGTITYPTAAIPDVAALINQIQAILNSWPEDYTQLQSDVSDLKSALNTGSIISKDWEQGSRGVTGENTSPLWAARCTSAKVYEVVPGAIVSVKNIDSGLKAVIAITNGTSFVYDSGWQTSNFTYTVTSTTAGKVLVNVAKVDGSDLAPSGISSLEFIVSPNSKVNDLEKDYTNLNNELDAVDWTATLFPNTGKFWYVNSTKLGLSEYSDVTAYDKVRTKKGDQFRLKTTGVGIAPPYIIVDDDDTILASCEPMSFDGILTITQDTARWVAVNVLNTALSTFEFYQANNNSMKQINTAVASLENKSALITNEFFSPVFQLVVGGSVDSTTGAYSYNAAYTNYAADEYYYPLEDGAKYIFAADGINYNIYLYDANKTFVEAVRANNNMLSGQYVFTNSNNRKYFRVACYRSGGMADYLKTLHVAMTYYPKKVVCIGDSITAGNGASVAYHMYLARETGWTCQNWGVSGSGYLNNMTTSTAVGGGVEGIATGGVVPDYDTDFVHAVEEIPSDADLYIVFGGYNDYNTNRTEADFETAVGTVLSYIQNNMPTSRILTITPQQVYKSGERDGKTANSAGLTLKDYADSIKKVSSEHAVKCIDLYTESGLYPYSSANSSQNYQSDGLHPSNNGQRLIYQAIMNDVLAMMSQKY